MFERKIDEDDSFKQSVGEEEQQVPVSPSSKYPSFVSSEGSDLKSALFEGGDEAEGPESPLDESDEWGEKYPTVDVETRLANLKTYSMPFSRLQQQKPKAKCQLIYWKNTAYMKKILILQLVALVARYFGSYGEFSQMEGGYEIDFTKSPYIWAVDEGQEEEEEAPPEEEEELLQFSDPSSLSLFQFNPDTENYYTKNHVQFNQFILMTVSFLCFFLILLDTMRADSRPKTGIKPLDFLIMVVYTLVRAAFWWLIFAILISSIVGMAYISFNISSWNYWQDEEESWFTSADPINAILCWILWVPAVLASAIFNFYVVFFVIFILVNSLCLPKAKQVKQYYVSQLIADLFSNQLYFLTGAFKKKKIDYKKLVNEKKGRPFDEEKANAFKSLNASGYCNINSLLWDPYLDCAVCCKPFHPDDRVIQCERWMSEFYARVKKHTYHEACMIALTASQAPQLCVAEYCCSVDGFISFDTEEETYNRYSWD